MGFTAAVLAASALVASAAAQHVNILQDHSFKGPFRAFDNEGNRKVPGWRTGGSTEVNEHFVRITNDRQSKKGWLWSEKNWNYLDGWTATLRLRVSGQGKRLFGDGENEIATFSERLCALVCVRERLRDSRLLWPEPLMPLSLWKRWLGIRKNAEALYKPRNLHVR